MCEGYTDVIGFRRAGVPRAVATCGTALTEDHVRLLKRFTNRIVLAFDADSAGQTAAERVYEWDRSTSWSWPSPTSRPGRIPPTWAPKTRATRCCGRGRPAVPPLPGRAGLRRRDRRPRGGHGPPSSTRHGREHPSDLVRDQYVMAVADRVASIRTPQAARRPRGPAAARRPGAACGRNRGASPGRAGPGPRCGTTAPLPGVPGDAPAARPAPAGPSIPPTDGALRLRRAAARARRVPGCSPAGRRGDRARGAPPDEKDPARAAGWTWPVRRRPLCAYRGLSPPGSPAEADGAASRPSPTCWPAAGRQRRRRSTRCAPDEHAAPRVRRHAHRRMPRLGRHRLEELGIDSDHAGLKTQRWRSADRC